jgi:hypothetical protein
MAWGAVLAAAVSTVTFLVSQRVAALRWSRH